MHVLIVHAHPEPESFTGALRAVAERTLTGAGHQVTVSDLYASGFDAAGGPGDFSRLAHEGPFRYQQEQAAALEAGTMAPGLAEEVRRVGAADLVILQFPLWWFGLPAILKGWVDRVFAFGFAYGPGRSHATGPLRGKRGMLALTTGAPEAAFGTGGPNGSLEVLLHPVQYGVLHFSGMDVLPPFVAWGAARVDDATRARYLERYRAHLEALPEMSPLSLGPLTRPVAPVAPPAPH